MEISEELKAGILFIEKEVKEIFKSDLSFEAKMKLAEYYHHLVDNYKIMIKATESGYHLN